MDSQMESLMEAVIFSSINHSCWWCVGRKQASVIHCSMSPGIFEIIHLQCHLSTGKLPSMNAKVSVSAWICQRITLGLYTRVVLFFLVQTAWSFILTHLWTSAFSPTKQNNKNTIILANSFTLLMNTRRFSFRISWPCFSPHLHYNVM